jgi:hypothetical protein
MTKQKQSALDLLKVAAGVTASLAFAMTPALIEILTGAH